MWGKQSVIGLVWKKSTVVLGCAIFVAICFLHGNLFAQDSSWTGGDPPKIKIGREIAGNYLMPGNRTCYDKTLQTFVYKNWNDSAPTETPVQQCVVRNPLGTFGANYLSPNTYHSYKTQLDNLSHSIVGVPSQPLFFVARPSPQPYGLNLSPYNDVRSTGNFESLRSPGHYSGMVYKFSGLKPFLKDSSGQPLNIFEFAFSENGQWMVAEASGIGLIRINLLNGEMTLFSNEVYYPGNGSYVYLTLAISNDGNYALKSGQNTGETTVYDVSLCQGTDHFSATSRSVTGCGKRGLNGFLRSNVDKVGSPDVVYLHSIRFSEDSRSFSGAVIAGPGSGKKSSRAVTVSLDTIPEEPQFSYMAMGDSFASGEGDTDDAYYEIGTNVKDVNMCHLSKRSYPYLVSEALQIDNFHSVACSGAREVHIIGEDENGVQYKKDPPRPLWLPGYQNQLRYLAGEPVPSFITVEIGGNDLEFLSILKACILPSDQGPSTCDYATDQGKRADLAYRIAGQFNDLKSLYEQLADSTKHQTKIYVLGYPQFINPDTNSCGLNVQLNNQERWFVYQSVHYANQVIKAASKAAGVYYIDEEDALKNQNLCSDIPDSQMTVNGITTGDDNVIPWYLTGPLTLEAGNRVYTADKVGIGNESFHPNQNGHKLLAQTFLGQTLDDPADFSVCNTTTEDLCPDSNAHIPLPDESYFGSGAVSDVSCLNTPGCVEQTVEKYKEIVREDLAQKRSFNISVDNLKPGSQVEVEIHSNPVELGSFTVDNQGALDADLTIPDSVPPGYHEIHVIGQDLVGEPIDYFQEIFLTGTEGDINADGIPDGQELCGFTPDSGVDYDQDGVDDACDGQINEPPAIPPSVDDITPLPNFDSNDDPPQADIIDSVDSQSQNFTYTQQSVGLGPQSQAASVPESNLSSQSQGNTQSVLLSNNFDTASLLNQTHVLSNSTSSSQSPAPNTPTETKGHVPVFQLSIAFLLLIVMTILFRMIDANRKKS